MALRYGWQACTRPIRDDYITLANCKRIRDGMAMCEVERILGGKPDLLNGSTASTYWHKAVTEGCWLGSQYAIRVTFDAQNRVTGKAEWCFNYPSHPQTLKERFYSWLDGWGL
jgi:hypothetical protein